MVGILMRSIIVLGRKAFHVIFALGLFLCSMELTSIIAGACSAPCDILCGQQSGRLKEFGQPRGCCCGANEPLCDVSKSCASGLPEFALSVVPMVKNPTPAHIVVNTTYVSTCLDFPAGINTVWTLAIGPPVPLFLSSLCLLC